jgi:hypothetical protein
VVSAAERAKYAMCMCLHEKETVLIDGQWFRDYNVNCKQTEWMRE